ncbi:hypothetical protein [Pseudonocardia sp.]|uniref:hypothetical protein n=1 Tax=Pseudonocardia sp. TaxID=60912 RepID=UPI003D0F1745
MSAAEELDVYLNDHLAGAHTGVEMARTLQREVAGEPDAELLGPIGDDVAADVETLRHVMERLGVRRNPVKQAAGWVAEKAHRIGVAASRSHGPDLARMLAAESLALGVEGKLALWVALSDAASAADRDRLADTGVPDLAGLADRARDQRRRLEAVRLAAARRAFART